MDIKTHGMAFKQRIRQLIRFTIRLNNVMIQQFKGWERTVALENAFVKKEVKQVSHYRIHSMSPWNLVTQEPQEWVGGSVDPPVRLDPPYGPFLTPP
jgi:hypothetical protein